MYVEFYSWETGQEVIFGKAILRKGTDKIEFEGLSDKMILAFYRNGVTKDGQTYVFPNEARKFLEALHYAVSGSMIRASMIKGE